MNMAKGKYNEAKIFTDNIDSVTMSQLIQICNQDWMKDSKIRIMPDCHAGKGAVIGFTATMNGRVAPATIGLDIGCGMRVLNITNERLVLSDLDAFVHQFVPAGHNLNEHKKSSFDYFKDLYCYSHLKSQDKFAYALGTLGGGNHFVEVDWSDTTNQMYLVIHTGSRNLGKQVAEYYQKVAIDLWKSGGVDHNKTRENIIAGLRDEKRGSDIPGALKAFDERFAKAHPQYPPELCFLYGETMVAYLHDMNICQEYAIENRRVIAQSIVNLFEEDESNYTTFETVHNYIDMDTKIMRKGAVSAKAGEKLIVPINMRDGSLLCVGKGNEDWNFSAPHGAGRLMARNQAKKNISMEDYKESMKDIYTTCVNESTLDESAMAYKPMQEIIDNVQDTVEIVDIIRPIYNFKNSE